MKSYASLETVQNASLPEWVPTGALHYIEHTEKGAPIRALARAAGCHASTVLRQIRKVEMRRDDPLVDAALRKLGAVDTSIKPLKPSTSSKKATAMTKSLPIPCDATLAREAMRVLRRLCETGAVLAVAEGLDKAVVVRDGAEGSSTRTAVVEASVAQAMALKDWIAPTGSGRITRYQITGTGRTALSDYLEKFGMHPEQASGFTQGQARLAGDDAFEDSAEGATGGADHVLPLGKARSARWRGGATRTANGFWTMAWCNLVNDCARISSWRRWMKACRRIGITS